MSTRKINRRPIARPRGTWTIKALEEAIEAIEVGKCSMQEASRSWNIPLNSLCDHLNERMCNKKMGLGVYS
jgi:hypothetical protein